MAINYKKVAINSKKVAINSKKVAIGSKKLAINSKKVIIKSKKVAIGILESSAAISTDDYWIPSTLIGDGNLVNKVAYVCTEAKRTVNRPITDWHTDDREDFSH